ncbi:MAG: TonB-dependent receptor [Prevotellaceae bacterium]|nr:TonB-dependent receptor [Prevotellaceae bacterium]
MRKIFTFIFLSMCITLLHAQETDAMLFGDVKEKVSGAHLPGATIQVKGTNLRTVCDVTGHFKLVHLPLGRQTIVASLVGYKSQEIEVTMSRGKGAEVYFVLEEDPLELEQVVVTGTRTNHFVKDVPIRTEVLTSQSMLNKNAQNLFEALEGVPGVRVEQQCQACNFTMVRMQGLGAEHTQVLVDGEPVYSGLAGVYGLQQMGTTDVDRLEIVKGAGSALYGSSAVAGAINIITKEPTFEPSLTADLQFGNYGYKSFNASGSMRRKNIGLNIFAQRVEEDAIDETQDGMTRKEVKHKDGISDRVESKLTNLGFGVYVFSPFADGDKLVIRGKATDEQRNGGQIASDLFRNPFSAGTEDIKTNRLSTNLNYTLPIGNFSELSLSLAYVFHRRNATNDTFLNGYMGSHNGEKPDVELMRPYLAKENTFTGSASYAVTMGRHRLLAGFQAYFTKLKETGMYSVDDSASHYYGTAYNSIGKKHAEEFGFFLQDEWNVTRNLSVVPGIRVDMHNSGEKYEADRTVFDSAFPETDFDKTTVNPRLAVKYEVSSALVLRANVGTGYRAPYGFSEDLHLCSGSPRVWKSSSLKGESSFSMNLSADYYGKNYQLSANLFRTNLRDKIEFVPADDNVKRLGYTYQWENVGDAYVQGVEMGVKLNLGKDLKTGVNATWNLGKYNHERGDWKETAFAKDSKYISRFPAVTGDFTLDYTPGTWTFSLMGSLQGPMYIDYIASEADKSKIKKTDAFMLFNCKVAKDLGKNFTVYAGGRNIFSYIQDEKHTDDAAFMYAPVYGASWYAGVSVKL